VIPDEAVEALARVLASKALWDADVAGTGWDSETDSSDHFMPSARKTARRYLEAAAPFIAAQAWDEGYSGGVREEQPGWTKNPYRAIVQAASGQNDNTEGVGA